jgi:PAS domain S-box-containing protein
MKNDGKGNQLRNRAYEILSEHNKSDMPLSDDFFELVHELQTYQVELEMQNEELQRTAEELEEAKLKYFSLYEFAPIGYFSLDEKEIIKDVNLAGTVLLGIEKTKLINSAFILYINSESRRTFFKHLKKVKTTGTRQTCELELIKNDTTKIYAHLETQPYEDYEEDFKGFRITVTDITELLNAEKALKESEERYHCLFKNNHAVMLLIDPVTGEIVDANPAAASFYGYSWEQLVKMKITDINQLTDKEVFEEMLNAKSGKYHYFLFKHRLANGEIRDVDVYSGSIIINRQNLLYSIIHDVTGQVKAENAFHQKKDELQTIIDSSRAFIFYKDKKNNFLRVNKTFAEILGISQEKLEGMSLFDIFPKEQAEAYWKDDINVIKSGKPKVDIIEPMPHKDGDRYVQTDKIPYRDSNGNIIGIIGFAIDITERKQAEEVLDFTMKELERSNKELEQFAYVASHDLQEPLRMVASFTQLLEMQYKDKLDEDAIEYISFAVDGAKRMQSLISDLLAYSRVTSYAGEFEEVDLNKVIEEVLFNLEIVIEENNAVITNETLLKISADYSQMVQVFQNIIGNALKYRSKKTPKIHISSRKEDDKWLFSVKDNGIGIDPEYSEKIFQIFRRLHTREEYEGTGIGLAITKRIIERHGGKIWVESEPGKGSTFYFTIPKND